MTFFWLLGFSIFFYNENHLGFYMRYHLFLHYGCFFQNLEKDFIRTNMHTTVIQFAPYHFSLAYHLESAKNA